MTGYGPDDPLPPSDDDLVDLLGRALVDDDEPPPHLVAAAQDALAWRDPDAALAELVEASAPAGVRGGSPRLEFAADDGRAIEVELRAAGGRAIAVGQVTSTSTGTVTATVSWVTPSATGEPTDVGAGGFFELPGVPRGPVRFTVSFAGGPELHTDWVIA